jgi:hypothetical protein
MRLIACKDCDTQISRSALRCPKCGGWQFVRPPRWLDLATLPFLILGLWGVYTSTTWIERGPALIFIAIVYTLAYGYAFQTRGR